MPLLVRPPGSRGIVDLPAFVDENARQGFCEVTVHFLTPIYAVDCTACRDLQRLRQNPTRLATGLVSILVHSDADHQKCAPGRRHRDGHALARGRRGPVRFAGGDDRSHRCARRRRDAVRMTCGDNDRDTRAGRRRGAVRFARRGRRDCGVGDDDDAVPTLAERTRRPGDAAASAAAAITAAVAAVAVGRPAATAAPARPRCAARRRGPGAGCCAGSAGPRARANYAARA